MIIILKYNLPISLPHGVPLAQGVCFEHKLRPGIATHIIPSNNNTFVKPKHHFLNPVDFEPHVAGAFVEENHFVHLVQLVQDNRPWQFLPGFQVGQHV